MNDGLYRQNAIERASTPEQLNEYIRVTNPGVWIMLLSVIVLLIGVCVWGVFGKLETTVDAVAVSDGSKTYCYVKDNGSLTVSEGDCFTLENETYIIVVISSTAKKVSECALLNERAVYLGGFSENDWVYELTSEQNIPDTTPQAVKIVTEAVSPLSFVFN